MVALLTSNVAVSVHISCNHFRGALGGQGHDYLDYTGGGPELDKSWLHNLCMLPKETLSLIIQIYLKCEVYHTVSNTVFNSNFTWWWSNHGLNYQNNKTKISMSQIRSLLNSRWKTVDIFSRCCFGKWSAKQWRFYPFSPTMMQNISLIELILPKSIPLKCNDFV